MENIANYIQTIQEGKTLVDNHNKLLESLMLSRQAKDNNVYTDQTTNRSADVNVNPGEGVGGSSSETPA